MEGYFFLDTDMAKIIIVFIIVISHFPIFRQVILDIPLPILYQPMGRGVGGEGQVG